MIDPQGTALSQKASGQPAESPGALKKIGASQWDEWNLRVGVAAMQTVAFQDNTPETTEEKLSSAFAGLMEIAPRDVLESMIAAQLIASHNAAMECYRLAMLLGQTSELQREYLNQANKLSRTHSMLLDALNRHRGKGQQKVTVEHVHVHAGGQAVVGVVEGRGRGSEKIEEQPHAKQIANASEPEMLRANTEGRLVSVASNAERPLPDARRSIIRRAKGK